MKKFNLFNEIIITNRAELLKAINSTKPFAITYKGEIIYDLVQNSDPLIFSGQNKPQSVSALTPPKPLSIADIFGKNYQIVEDDERVLIKAFSNWQELIALNADRASYDDTTADGVAEFSNKELEEIGWHATEFNIKYRTLVELVEEKCEGIILCIEQEDPYQFSGYGFITDNDCAKKVLFEYCKTEATKLMEDDPLFAPENLEDDEAEAAKFFGLL